ncbi:peptidoglycan recognition protein family protein [Streptomyces zaomyceticus]|uniref:peptidoglycan recognition protein family protein n=1 Tax=Streptomyces zaomyceticus TaxID=68286 RepID=UPI0036A11334
MAWYPDAEKMELQPESDQQAAIKPTQFIVHSIIAPWTARRTYEYWRDSTNLESHFGVDYLGTVGQYIGTQTRADANAGANRRPDGTGAVSAETASNLEGSDPWNDKQVEDLIAIGVWLHKMHEIPLRICRTHDDPGFGYHSMFPEWSTNGTSCPGPARIRQFKTVVFPGIVARATGTEEEDDMTPEERKLLVDTAAAVKRIEASLARSPWTYKQPGITDKRDMNQILRDVDKAVKVVVTTGQTPAQTDALAKRIAAHLATDLSGRLTH